MKIRCRRKELLDGFQAVAGVVSPKTIKQIHQCVKLATQGTRLELLVTDLELSMRYWTDTVALEGEGAAVLPAATVASILRESAADEVSLDVDQGVCNLRAGDDDFRLLGMEPEEFPPIPAFSEAGVVEVEAVSLQEMIRRTTFAAAREKTRYALNTVLLQVKGEEINLVATDGRRLARCVDKTVNAAGLQKAVLLSIRGMQQFEKSLAPEDEVARLQIDDNLVILRTPRAEVSARVVEGTFPSYAEVIPKQGDKVLEMKAGAFVRALRRASILAPNESRCVRLVLTRNRLKLFSRSAAVGDAKVEVDCGYQGADFEIHFNPDYLVDGLKVIPEDQDVTFEMTEKSAPGKLVEAPGFTYVVMPINME